MRIEKRHDTIHADAVYHRDRAPDVNAHPPVDGFELPGFTRNEAAVIRMAKRKKGAVFTTSDTVNTILRNTNATPETRVAVASAVIKVLIGRGLVSPIRADWARAAHRYTLTGSGLQLGAALLGPKPEFSKE